MKTFFVASVAVALVAGLCAAAGAGPMPAPPEVPTPEPHIRFEGGDGSSCDQAVVVVARKETEGIRAQRWWVWSKNPGAVILDQKVTEKGDRDLETITFQLPGGAKRSVCFDITSFIGKI